MRSTGMPPEVALAGAVADLRGLARTLAELSADGVWSQVCTAALPDLVASLLAATDRATAAATTGVGVLHRSGALSGVGYVSTSRWLQAKAGLSKPGAGAMLARSRDLHVGYAATRDAWLAGEVSGAVVREVTDAITTLFRGAPTSVRAQQERVAEKILLDVARDGGTPADVRRAAARIRIFLDPQGADSAALAAYDDQTLTCTRVGTMTGIAGWLDHEGAAVVEAALDAIIDRWYRDGTLPEEDLPSEGDDALGEARDRRRRRARRAHLRALALVELARRQLDDATLGRRHDAKPHITYLLDTARVDAGLGGDLVVAGHHDPIPVTAATLARVLCDAEIHPVLVSTEVPGGSDPGGAPTSDDPECNGGSTRVTSGPDHNSTRGRSLGGSSARQLSGHDGGALSPATLETLVALLAEPARTVLYPGRAHRTVPPRLRRALEARDRHCTGPGCRVEPARCHAHHIHEWALGGRTDLDNLALVCPAHHRLVHEGRWTITRTPGIDPATTGAWTFDPPDRQP